jgi:hypothetical protein
MRRLSIVLATVFTSAALLLPHAADAMMMAGVVAGIGNAAPVALPIEKVAVCYGVGWRGPGYYPAIFGLRPACWDTLPYGGPVYPAPAYAAPPVAAWYCDNPKGYFPNVAACGSGWRAVPVTP